MNNWKINGVSTEELGLTVATWTERNLSASELVLEVAAEQYDANTAFSVGDDITLSNNGAPMFTGRVRSIPRNLGTDRESYSYLITDAWHELDRIVYQEAIEYIQRVPDDDPEGESEELELIEVYSGAVTFEPEETLGARISKVLSYAAGTTGSGFSIGAVADGVTWYRTSYKDQTCGEIIRGIMRLMPDYVLWLDTRSYSPTFHLQHRDSLPSVNYFIYNNQIITGHSIAETESESISSVVIRYEKPISIDSDSRIEIIQDVHPPGATGREFNSLVESVALQGSSFQSEYAPIVTRPMPLETVSEASKVDWWIDQTPELAAIAEAHGKSNLAAILKVSDTDVDEENVIKHNLKLVDEIEVLEPVNPNAIPVSKGTQPSHFPRQIVSGNLPEWARRRHARIRVSATLAISKTNIDAVADVKLKKALQEIFSLPKKFGGTNYATANFSGEVTGTNAQTKNYKRLVTYDLGEQPPSGIASQIYTQLNATRYTGALELVAYNPNTDSRPGTTLNVLGGRPEWSNMQETVQEISFDIQRGTTSIIFGPPDQLGAADLIERLRANRANSYTHNRKRTKPVIEGIGGAVASADAKFARIGGGSGEATHPWQVTISKEGEVYTAKITDKGTEVYNRGTNDLFGTLTGFATVPGSTIKEWSGALAGDGYVYLVATWTAAYQEEPSTFEIVLESTEKDVIELATDGNNVTYQSVTRRLIGIAKVDGSGYKIDQRVFTPIWAADQFLFGYIGTTFEAS